MFKYSGSKSELPDWGLIPSGRYTAKIVDAVEGVTKEGNRDKVVVDYQIVEGKYSGRKIRFHHVVFHERGHKSYGMALHFLKTIGEPWEGDNYTVDSRHWLGKHVIIDVGETEDHRYNRVNWVNPIIDKASEKLGQETIPF